MHIRFENVKIPITVWLRNCNIKIILHFLNHILRKSDELVNLLLLGFQKFEEKSCFNELTLPFIFTKYFDEHFILNRTKRPKIW